MTNHDELCEKEARDIVYKPSKTQEMLESFCKECPEAGEEFERIVFEVTTALLKREKEIESLKLKLSEAEKEIERLKVDPHERSMFLEEIASLKAKLSGSCEGMTGGGK